MLLSIGANDIYFSGLVADVIVDTPTERALFRRSGVMASVDDARGALTRDLPQGFSKLREALKPLVGDMSRVVYTSYANPTLAAGGAPCPGGRAGFDIHPSFNAEPQRLAAVSNFVESEFLPQLKALALCQSGILCRNPRADRMTFVDAHQAAFADHGFCARAQTDPEFDRQCFSATGESFDPDLVTAASQPMLCGRSAGEYRAYLPRARWIRDANDSYFAAMTYPQGLPSSQQPSDIHDATWGVLSAVYGGAVHPSAKATPRWRTRHCRRRPPCCSSMPPCRRSSRSRCRRLRPARNRKYVEYDFKQPMRVRILAARCARGLQIHSPSEKEGAGKAGCALHPRSRVQCALGKSAHEHTGSAETLRPSLRNGFNGLYRALPGDEFVLSPSQTD